MLRTNEFFGVNHLIDILRGLSSTRVRDLSHDELPTFGVGNDLNKHQWQAIFLQLLGLDYIRPSVERRGALFLTKKALPVLKGQQTVILKSTNLSEALKVKKTARPQSLISEQDEPLFSALRRKRKELAEFLNVPSYIVFSDKTLLEMTDKKPRNLDELCQISGVGQKKLFKFGTEFLRVINGTMVEKTHRVRRKIAGKSNAWLYDLIQEVVNNHYRGENEKNSPISI